MCREQRFPEPAPGELHSSKPQTVSKLDVGKKMKKNQNPRSVGAATAATAVSTAQHSRLPAAVWPAR